MPQICNFLPHQIRFHRHYWQMTQCHLHQRFAIQVWKQWKLKRMNRVGSSCQQNRDEKFARAKDFVILLFLTIRTVKSLGKFFFRASTHMIQYGCPVWITMVTNSGFLPVNNLKQSLVNIGYANATKLFQKHLSLVPTALKEGLTMRKSWMCLEER